MNEWPSVCILLLTYEPGERQTAARTLVSALDNISYSGPLHVHIADDGSPPEHREMLREIAGGYERVCSVGETNAERGGYGRSYNLATQIVHLHHSIVLPLEDDWELTRDFDLDPLVETLIGERDHEHGPVIDCIRLGYIGYTQPLLGELYSSPAGMLLLFDPESYEPHVFAGHPRVETREFERRVGEWPEGIPAGATEWTVAHRPDAREGIAFPLDLIHPRGDLFVHIGALGLGELQPS